MEDAIVQYLGDYPDIRDFDFAHVECRTMLWQKQVADRWTGADPATIFQCSGGSNLSYAIFHTLLAIIESTASAA